VTAATRSFITLDFGADSVIIPHVLDATHAATVCVAAKYPPLGRRSFAANSAASSRS